jgi:hypothetical protein
VALTDSQGTGRGTRLPFAGVTALTAQHIRTWLNDDSDRTVAQRVAGTAFLMSVFLDWFLFLSHLFISFWL